MDHDSILSFSLEEMEEGIHEKWLKDSGMDQFLIPEGSPLPIQKKKNLHPPSSKGIF